MGEHIIILAAIKGPNMIQAPGRAEYLAQNQSSNGQSEAVGTNIRTYRTSDMPVRCSERQSIEIMVVHVCS